MRRVVLVRATRLFATVLAGVGVAHATEPVTAQSLLGDWAVPESRTDETYVFLPGGVFQLTMTARKKDGKDIPPTTYRSEGAYEFGSGACTVGKTTGNLYVAKQADRCCFVAYMMGRTLVLDNIHAGGVLGGGFMCQNRTLTRRGAAPPPRDTQPVLPPVHRARPGDIPK